MKKGLYILIFIFSFFEVGFTYAQDSEQILSEKGVKLFDNEDFVIATPIYLQLLALQPRSPEYNYKYGACLLFNSTNRKSALKYLEFATSNQDVNPDAFYFMGKAFHLNYQFEKAIKFYKEYQIKSKAKINKSWEVDRQIQSCENGKLLLKNISDIVVLEKKSTLASSFYSAYDLSEIGGDIVISDVDQSKIDKKKAHRPLIYFPPNANRVYFGSYGESGTSGTDIYVKEKYADGSWSKPALVSGQVNSNFDENYPFMDVKNGYLYFSSKGHNSMGGYDIFKSKYDPVTNSFGQPENLDFAISSTDNDLFYIKDNSEDFAWFASSRQSKDGKIDVYKVKIERVSVPVIAAQGTFNSTVHQENKNITIEVKDLSSNKIIGTYYTDDKGNYLITFPKSGKYQYTINVFGSETPFTEVVEITAKAQMSIVKQQITHAESLDQEFVEVINLKDDISPDSEILAAIMNSKAELNPNAELLNTKKNSNSAEIDALLSQLDMDKMSVFEAANKTEELIDSQKKELIKNEDFEQKALQFISDNNKFISNLQLEIKNSVAKTHGDIEESERKALLDQASKKIEQINQLELENKQLLHFADSIQKSNNTLVISTKDLKTFGSDLMKAQAGGDDAIFKVLSQNTSLIKNLQNQSKELKNSSIQTEISTLTQTNQKNNEIIKSYQSNSKNLENEIQVLEEKKLASKNKKLEEIQIQIDAKRNDLALIENEIQNVEVKNNKITEELKAKNQQLFLVQQVDKKSKPATKKSIAEIQKEIKTVDNQNFRTLKSYVAQQQEITEANKVVANETNGQNDQNENESNTVSEVKTKSSEIIVENQVVSNKQIPEEKAVVSYQADLAQIESNTKLNQQQKEVAILKSEIEFQKNLALAIQEVQKELTENPFDENATNRYNALNAEKENNENRISEQSQIVVASEVNGLDSEKILSKVDPNYTKDIQKIEKSKSENKAAELLEREILVQKKLKEKIEANQKLLNQSNDVSLLAENQVINTLIEASELRVDSIKSQNESKELIANAYVAQVDAFRMKTLGENNSLLKNEFKTESEIIQQQKILTNYLDVLEHRLEDLRTKMKENSSAALETDFEWTIDELEAVEKKLAEISHQLTTLEAEKENVVDQVIEKEVDVEKTETEGTNVEQIVTVSEVKTKVETEVRTEVETETKIKEVENELVENEFIKESVNQKEYVAQKDAFRTSTLAANSNILTSDFDTEVELKDQQNSIKAYQDILENRLVELRSEAKNNSSTALQSDLKWTIDELDTVENKLGDISKDLNLISSEKETTKIEVENEIVKNETIEKEITNEKTVKTENVTENILVENEPKSEIILNTQEQTESPAITEKTNIKSTETIESIEKLNKENQSAISALKVQATKLEKAQLEDIQRTSLKVDAEVSEISKIKNEETKAKMLNKIEQDQLVAKEQISEIEREQYYDQLVQSLENVNDLNTNELETISKLETKQRRYRIEIGELSVLINQLDTEISTLNKKKSKELLLERDQKQSLLTSIQAALEEVEAELNNRQTKTLEIINSTEALKQSITLDEEQQQARSAEYKEIQKDYKEITALNVQVEKAKSDIGTKQKEIETVISESQKLNQELEKSVLENKLTEINKSIASLSQLENQRNVSQNSFAAKLDKTTNPEVVKNLLVRGVTPIAVTETKVSELAVREFKILTPQEKTIRKVIVLDEVKPTGLLYRVQVGAFSKPINETLFSEFTPISGEKLNNGITRYMVGNFNKRESVMAALEKVRKIGYADAFPVAYCNGERISMFEAKRLEEAGLCLAQGADQLDIKEQIASKEIPVEEKVIVNVPETKVTQTEVVANEIVNEKPIEVTQVETEKQVTPEIQNETPREQLSPENEKLAAYNKAPGAAVAYAVETRLGLFFTVQVGVYNKPVPSSQMFDIKPLVTQRLDNGQVRYSTGIFHSVADAKPKKTEAVLLGITDAYITAYYEGKRISVQEARELLAAKGESILEPLKLVENKVLTEEQLTVVETKMIQEEDVKIEKIKENIETSKVKVQLISKKQYASFPLDVIRRYNQKGDFYYDKKDQRVKSMIYSASSLPSIYGFKEDLDTLIVRTKTRQEVSEEKILKVEYNQTTLPGHIGDWLLRFGYLRELTVVDDHIELTIFGITDPIDYEFLMTDLRSLGFDEVPVIKE